MARRVRGTPLSSLSLLNPPIAQKRNTSPARLLGYLVGGILLSNLVLMTSSAFRGHAATALGSDAVTEVRMDARTDALAQRENEAEEMFEPAKPLIANLCADAREKLVAGLTLYYLQRSRRPAASHDEVLESASASALLAGPGDPAAMPSGIPCAG